MDNAPDQIRSLYAQQQYAKAADYIREVITGPETRGEEWSLIANGARSLGDRFAVAKAARRWREEAGTNPDAHIFLANQLTGVHAMEEALQAARNMRAAYPDYSLVWFAAGEVEAQAGAIDKAVNCYRKAWELDQTFTGAWERIAWLKDFKENDPDLRIVFALPQAAESLGPSYKIAAHYACADVLDKLGDSERAFPHYVEAIRKTRESFTYDMNQQLGMQKNALNAFTGQILSQFKGKGIEDVSPIFVMGPPRSGAALVDQILTSHSDVGGGETSALRVMSWPLKDYAPNAVGSFIAYGEKDRWSVLAKKYLSLMEEVFGSHPVMLNRETGSIASLGLISILFPKAKIIFVDRDPMDMGWSCFKTRLAENLPWTHDLQDIARYFAAFRHAKEEWSNRVALDMLDVKYEDLVADPDSQIDRILTFCGLAPEPAVSEFYKTERMVPIPSTVQVRKPIYQTSVGAWEKYSRYLGPLEKALERYAVL